MIPANNIARPFLRAALFDGLSPLQITELVRNAERMIFCDGDIITKAGEEGYGAYLIVSGKLAYRGPDGALDDDFLAQGLAEIGVVANGDADAAIPGEATGKDGGKDSAHHMDQDEGHQRDDALRPLAVDEGAIIDEMAMLIDGHRSAATIVAQGQVRAYRLARAALHEQMEADADLADHFVQKIAQRLYAVTGDLREIQTQLRA